MEVACRNKRTQRKKGVMKREGALMMKVFLCNDCSVVFGLQTHPGKQ